MRYVYSDMEHATSHTDKDGSLKRTVLDRIDREGVCPRSRLFFQSRECLVWTLWLVTVLGGALAVAVSLFVLLHRRYALYEATHANFLTFLVEVLPYVWLLTFAVMILCAVINLRRTRRGYRYSISLMAISSVLVSFAGGALLQLFGLGALIDHEFGQFMPTYPSQARLERALWQAPTEGRLLGTLVGPVGVATATVWFRDVEGDRWQVNITDFHSADHQTLSSRERVRLLGVTRVPVSDATTSTARFHACGAFPWFYDSPTPMSTEQLDATRQDFLRRVYEHKENARERLAVLERARLATATQAHDGEQPGMGPCADLPVVRRVERSMESR